MLFLALAVQSPAYEGPLTAGLKAGKRAAQRGADWIDEAINFRQLIPALAGLFAPALIASCILTFGVYGEVLALIALYQQRSAGQPVLVITSAAFLAVASAGGPAVALIRSTAVNIRSFVTAINGMPAEPPAVGPGAGPGSGRPA